MLAATELTRSDGLLLLTMQPNTTFKIFYGLSYGSIHSTTITRSHTNDN